MPDSSGANSAEHSGGPPSVNDGPSPGRPFWRDQEEIVISGVSGRFPRSDNVQQFGDLLMAGEDLVTEDDLRWPPGWFLKGEDSFETAVSMAQAFTICQNDMEN